MAKTEIINDDPFCEVRLANIEHNGHKTDKFMIELMNAGNDGFKEIPGVGTVHSADYKLVTNQQVRTMAESVMSDTGMDFNPVPSFSTGHSQPIHWNGRRFSQKWYCKDTSVDVPGGSAMMMGMEVTNSYDGSCKVGLAFFAMHMVCSNQFYSANMMGRPFEFPHVNRGGDLDEDIGEALKQIRTMASGFGAIGPHVEKLNAQPIGSFSNFLKLRSLIRRETRAELRDKQLLDEIAGHGITAELKMANVKYNDEPTLWDVANAYTAVATHSVGGYRGADQSGRVIDWLLKRADISV